MALASSTGLAAAGVLPAPVQVAAQSVFHTVGVEIPDAPRDIGAGEDETLEPAQATSPPTSALPEPARDDQRASRRPQRLTETTQDILHSWADPATTGPAGMLGEVGGVSTGTPGLAVPGRPTPPSTNPVPIPSPTSTTAVGAPPGPADGDNHEEQREDDGEDVVDVRETKDQETPAAPLAGPSNGVPAGVGGDTFDERGPLVAPDLLPARPVPPVTVTEETLVSVPPGPSLDDRLVKGKSGLRDRGKRRERAATDVLWPPVEIVRPISDTTP